MTALTNAIIVSNKACMPMVKKSEIVLMKLLCGSATTVFKTHYEIGGNSIA